VAAQRSPSGYGAVTIAPPWATIFSSVSSMLDVDVRADAGLASDGQVRHEVTDYMAGAILEARILAVRVHIPAEHAVVEGGRLLRVLRGDAEIGDSGDSEDPRFVLISCRHGLIVAGDAFPHSSGGLATPLPTHAKRRPVGRRFPLAYAMGREGLEPSTLRLRGWLRVCGPLRLFAVSRLVLQIHAWTPSGDLRLFVGVVLPICCPPPAHGEALVVGGAHALSDAGGARVRAGYVGGPSGGSESSLVRAAASLPLSPRT
jgi:hypothetical protein